MDTQSRGSGSGKRYETRSAGLPQRHRDTEKGRNQKLEGRRRLDYGFLISAFCDPLPGERAGGVGGLASGTEGSGGTLIASSMPDRRRLVILHSGLPSTAGLLRETSVGGQIRGACGIQYSGFLLSHRPTSYLPPTTYHLPALAR